MKLNDVAVMSMVLYRLPAGIPGGVSRPGSFTIIEQNNILPANPPLSYGIPVAVDAATGKIRPIGFNDTNANVFGILVRPFPTQSAGTALGTATPPTSGMCDVLKVGYMCVQVNAGNPSKNSAVYVRTVANGGNTIIGGIEAASDSTNTFQLTGAYFTGTKDADGNCEIAYALQ